MHQKGRGTVLVARNGLLQNARVCQGPLHFARVAVLGLLLMMALGACADGPTAPSVPHRPYVPPQAYSEWYVDLGECTGVHRPYSAIKWFTVEGEYLEIPGVGRVWAYYRDGTITLMSWVPEDPVLERWIVQHEMLHYLLDPVGGHPEPPFGHGPGGCEWLGYG